MFVHIPPFEEIPCEKQMEIILALLDELVKQQE